MNEEYTLDQLAEDLKDLVLFLRDEGYLTDGDSMTVVLDNGEEYEVRMEFDEENILELPPEIVQQIVTWNKAHPVSDSGCA